MKRYERLGFETEREYRGAAFEMYEKATSLEHELLIMEKLMKSITYMLFNEEENLYFLPSTSVEKFQGTPFANVHYFYEEVVGGYIVSGEDLKTLFETINIYYYHERMELRRKQNAEKVAEQLKLCEELKREQEEKEQVTEVESSVEEQIDVEDDEMTEAEFLGYTLNDMNKAQLSQELIDNYLALSKEPIRDKKARYVTEIVKIIEILLKRKYITLNDYISYLSRIERELNKDLDA